MTQGPHIVVCLKVVPKSEEVGVDMETKTLDRANARSEINPPDMNALEAALDLKERHGGRVSVLSMGPPLFAPYLRVALAMGADAAYLLSDRAFGGADTLATSLTLATAIKKMGDVDLVLCGEESSDGATAQVPPGIATWLGLPQATYALAIEYRRDEGRLTVTREITGGEEELDVPLPAILSVKVSTNEPRFMDPDRFALLGDETTVTIWSAADLDLPPERIGLPGSPTSVAGVRQASQAGGARKREFVRGSAADEAAILYERIKDFLAERAAEA